MTTFETALYTLWPRGDTKIPGLRAAMVEDAAPLFEQYGINTQTAMIHFMAQISHECGAGLEVEENLNYTAQRMTEVWPKRFPTVASAQPYAHNPQMLANKVYNGIEPDGSDRMGNRPGSNDGWLYRGRGATQLTGRYNYSKLGNMLGLDLLRNPDTVNDPAHFLQCGVADFIMCKCLQPALAGDLNEVTRRLNGGYIGLAERRQWLAKWQNMNVALPVAPGHSSQVRVPKTESVPAPTPAPKKGFWEALAALFGSLMEKK